MNLFPSLRRPRDLLGAAVCALLTASCAVPPGAPGAPPAAAARPDAVTNRSAAVLPGPVPMAMVSAGAPRPFVDVVKDARPSPGLFTVWQKDERLWLEIGADQFDKPFFLSINLSRGIGDRWLLGGMMGVNGYLAGGEYIVQFRRAAGNVQLIARNTQFMARPGSPEERAVRNAFSDSLLAAAPIASAPHPERRSILIDANALLLADIPRGSHILEREYRNSYAFDPRNSFFLAISSSAERTVLDVTAHYAQPRIPLPSTPGGSPSVYFPPPDVLEDPRSLFLGFLYTFSKLPEQPMTPRLADSRIGHMTQARIDFSDESAPSPVRHYVNRWRVEPKSATTPSPPIRPIVFWVGNEVPVKHRAAIQDGILEWNKAFERIGITDAIVVKQQPDDSTFDLGETQFASVRWMTSARPSFGAFGPSHVDPRSGEILDADIGIDANIVRRIRLQRSEQMSYAPMFDPTTGSVRTEDGTTTHGHRACAYLEQATREAGFALALLEARGELDPDSPESDAFVAAFLKDVTMHEVGHALGLRHNFRASTVYTAAQMADRQFTARHGLIGSVMDYAPVNLALKSERQGEYFMSTLGAYDYWAIEYSYKPIAPESESVELARIAARSTERELAFATDEDVFFAIDPYVNPMDLGTDPLAFFGRRVQLSQELWQRLEARKLKPGDSYSVLLRQFLAGFDASAQAMVYATKYVGGAEIQSERAGSSRLPITPITAAQQREALTIIDRGLFRSDSLRVSRDFQRRLTVDRLERADPSSSGMSGVIEFSVSDRVLAVQRDVLNRLMSPTVARRVLANDAVNGVASSSRFTLAQLYGTLQASIWDEARRGVESDSMRRGLQREHLRRVSLVLLAPSSAFPADARSLMKQDGRRLQEWLDAAALRPGLSAETRAHYAEAANTLRDALKAPLIRTGV